MSVKKRKTYLIIAIVALSAMAGAALWHFYPQARDKAEEAILEQALSGQDDLANIVFKTFSLTQGESGLEAWRLKAEVASVRKDSGMIHVEKPKITYFTRPDNQEVQVSAEHGVGQLRRDELRHYKSDVELALMQCIKQSLDPHRIMNPGKLI